MRPCQMYCCNQIGRRKGVIGSLQPKLQVWLPGAAAGTRRSKTTWDHLRVADQTSQLATQKLPWTTVLQEELLHPTRSE